MTIHGYPTRTMPGSAAYRSWAAVGGGLCLRWPRRAGGGSASDAVRPGDDLHQMTVGVFEVQAAAAVAVVDRPGLGPAWICPIRQVLAADAAKRRIEFLLADEKGVMLGVIVPVVSAKSRETPLSASTTRKCANRVAAGSPRIPVRNAADRCWSRHETMVWFSCTLTSRIVPSVQSRERPAPETTHPGPSAQALTWLDRDLFNCDKGPVGSSLRFIDCRVVRPGPQLDLGRGALSRPRGGD
jgi:hypothetical protein